MSDSVFNLMNHFNLSNKYYDMINFLYNKTSIDKVKILLHEHHVTGIPIYDCIVNMKDFEEEEFLDWLSSEKDIEYFNLHQLEYRINQQIIGSVGICVLTNNAILPIKANGKNYIIMHNFRRDEYERINTLFDCVLTPALASKFQILEGLHNLSKKYTLSQFVQKLLDSDNGWPEYTAEFWNVILDEAIQKNVSDIHFTPSQLYITIRFRINGTLAEQSILHKKYWSKILSRLKVLTNMNINDIGSSQDGRMNTSFCGQDIDIRASCHPTIWGESVVLRLLHSFTKYSIEDAGYKTEQVQMIKEVIEKKSGLTILTGPTGSGKTTSVYSLLKLFSPNLNIMTLEDPVEYKLKNMAQTDLTSVPDMSYTHCIKSIMRQDPDIIFIGEIRDADSARLVARAAMTGHHVISTMHTNTAREVLARFEEFGVSTRWIVEHINVIIAQKLVRTLCAACKIPYQLSLIESEMFDIGINSKVYQAQGCDQCTHTGYDGRKPVAEMLRFNDSFSDIVLDNLNNVNKYLKMNKIRTLREEIIYELKAGVISVSEAKSLMR